MLWIGTIWLVLISWGDPLADAYSRRQRRTRPTPGDVDGDLTNGGYLVEIIWSDLDGVFDDLSGLDVGLSDRHRGVTDASRRDEGRDQHPPS